MLKRQEVRVSTRTMPGQLITTALWAGPALSLSLSGNVVALGEKTASEWIVQLKAPRPEARVEAVQALCAATDPPRDPAALEALVGTLKDMDARVRYASVNGLGCLGDQRGVGPLIDALRDRNPGVRELAANVLGHGFSADRRSVGALVAALKDPSAAVRSMAAGGLYNINDVQALDALLEGLRDADPQVRADVARALGKIGGPRRRIRS